MPREIEPTRANEAETKWRETQAVEPMGAETEHSRESRAHAAGADNRSRKHGRQEHKRDKGRPGNSILGKLVF